MVSGAFASLLSGNAILSGVINMGPQHLYTEAGAREHDYDYVLMKLDVAFQQSHMQHNEDADCYIFASNFQRKPPSAHKASIEARNREAFDIASVGQLQKTTPKVPVAMAISQRFNALGLGFSGPWKRSMPRRYI